MSNQPCRSLRTGGADWFNRMEVMKMKIGKSVLLEALKVLGKVVVQTSPGEVREQTSLKIAVKCDF